MSEPLGPGDPLPTISVDVGAGPITLEELRDGKPLVVAFYTEDKTPLCAAQLGAFRDDFELITELGAVFVGISADDAASHAAFAAESDLPFPLAADTKLEAARAFGVVDETGKRSIRAIFVADGDGIVVEAILYYNPSNGQQYQAVFAALGMDLG